MPVDRVTEYLSELKEATVESALTSPGPWTRDSWRIKEANSALPRKVDCTKEYRRRRYRKEQTKSGNAIFVFR